MRIKLGNRDLYSFSDIQKLKNTAGRFVVFQWIIPLPMFPPIKRLSKVYFIENEHQLRHFAKKSNFLNYLLGWWGLPFGPVYLFKSVRLNNSGGIDVTDDVWLNINERNYNNGFVDIAKKATIFLHPKKNEIVEFEKVFCELIFERVLNATPVIGLFIDTKKNESPYYLIGLDEPVSEEMSELITKAIYKRFYKTMAFKLIDLSSMQENKDKLLSQGLKINCR